MRRTRGVEEVVKALRANPRWAGSFVHWQHSAARPGRGVEFPSGLHPLLIEAYRRRGIERVWTHQAAGIEAALAGRDVLTATPTASGKTLCLTAPVLHSLLTSGGEKKSLFLYPTKALAQDQAAGLTALCEELRVLAEEQQGEPGVPDLGDLHAFTYDGDTPPSVRRTLRGRGHLILTNPHMLHQGILPNHAKWSELFRDLEYVVVDELHTLNGVFGSSVANVMRRVLRIARHYGSNPRFLAASATLREPHEHARRVFGRDVAVVSEDTSPSGARTFGLYNPPILDAVAGLRANALEEARELAGALCGPAHQTIFFCGRRTAVEVLTRYLKEAAPQLGLKQSEIRGYRGGYLPLLRREIEEGLKTGEIKVVVSTNALELGVDIGALDACVLVGYPGTQASFWQRAGRVGRRGNPSLVVQIARSEPVDQYLTTHPELLYGEPQERLGLDPDNLVLLSEQVKCAAFELPFEVSDEGELVDEPEFQGSPHVPEVLDYLAHDVGLLHEKLGRYYWMADAYPAQDVSLAGGEADNVLVFEIDPRHSGRNGADGPADKFAPEVANQRAIGEVDREHAFTTVHEGAIYQVEGETWRIERFDYANRRAYARRVDSDYFTDAETDTEVRVLRLEERASRTRSQYPVADPRTRLAPGSPPAELDPEDELAEDCAIEDEDHTAWRGEVHLTTVATLFKKVRFYTRENLGAGEIHLPPEELDTEAFVLTLSEETAAELGLVAGDRGSAWRGVGTMLRRVAPLFIRCQPSDLGLSAQIRGPHFGRPTIFLYDRVQGGVGLAELLYHGHRALLAAALEVVKRCACDSGCPACVGPRAEVGKSGKSLVRKILEHLVQGPAPAS